MKVLLFVLFAGYAVRCDDKNYYVIEMLEETIQKPFKVYWNVPTKQCKSKKVPFKNLYEKYGIIQNKDDAFMGEKVTILYDPGLFPALLKNETSGRFKFRNGGVPQEGDLNKHLKAFKEELDISIPDEGFSGIGIIDFESWRPTYRQNFGVLRPYQDVSYEVERSRHWWWQDKWLRAEAKRRFEEAARTFMQTTIALAKQLRPRARWGFYGFPYCFNMASNNMVEACAANVPHENDNISWLWQESSALYPSVYSSVDLSTRQMTSLIRGRVREAARVGGHILPYFWYRYRDAGFLTEVDLKAALSTLYKSNASGFIIWGSSSDVDSVDKCNELLNYIEKVMGPAIAKYTKSRRLQDETEDAINTTTDGSTSDIENATTEAFNTSTSNPANDTIKIKDLDPEYHWVPPQNYTQAIKDHVEEEINKKLTNYTGTEETVLDNNVLIDLILNSLINNVSYGIENATRSNEDNSTTKIVNSQPVSELQSSTTTERVDDLKTESTPISPYTVNYTNNKEVNLSITSTESLKSLEETTSNDYRETTENTNLFLITFKSKNIKKTTFQGNFDISTQSLSTETIESSTSQIEIVDNIEANTDTTVNDYNYSNEISVKVTTPQTDRTEATTASLHDENNFQESTTINTEISTSTSSYRILKADDSNYNYTTESSSIVSTELNKTTSPDFKEKNETIQTDLIERSTNIDSSSTKAPAMKDDIEATEAHVEVASLSTTTTSPEQVSGSAHRITKSQTLFCIVFYIYSVSKCLCSIFRQCS